MATQDELKHEAAQLATSYIGDGMIVGLGSGSTAEFFIRDLADRVRGGLRIVGIPTSERSEALAHELGIPLTTLDQTPHIDLTVDGADEADLTTFNVIKGLGGALLREKIVAAATTTQVIIVDGSKVVNQLGEHGTVPVEVIPFGWHQTAARLDALGANCELRGGEEHPFVTDGGNFILHCHFSGIADAAALAAQIKAITGVVEHGMFINLVQRIVVAGSDGVRAYEKGAN